MNRVRIKICGITLLKQAIEISRLPIDALGFVLYPKSPRYIDTKKTREIIKALPPFLKTVGVFVNEPIESLSEIMQKSGLDIAQLSGDESAEYCQQLSALKINWLQSFRIKTAEDLRQVSQYPRQYLLLDAWSKHAYGGTGQTFDWGLMDSMKDRNRIILAGGLNPNNIESAIREVQPYAIDVSSGVETSPGNKSMEKIQKLLDGISRALI